MNSKSHAASVGTPQPPVLAATDVCAGYGQTNILNGLTLAIQPGQIYALLGANGAGKTTTLSLFLGFVKATVGSVTVNGIDPVADPSGARRQLAYIPENVALYEHLSARENVAYLLDLAGQKITRDEIALALAAAGLAAIAFDRRVAGFSKGMRQKVAIALALARRVPALLLDEPTSGLDPQATAEFHQSLLVLREHGVATLMVTHDLLSAADIADSIGFIGNGRIAEKFSAQGSERFDIRALHRRYGGEAA